MTTTALIWFRRDLRLTHHVALHAARKFDRIIPVYIHAPDAEAPWSSGAASNWWLHHSLTALSDDLHRCGSRLIVRQGKYFEQLLELAKLTGATDIFCHQIYEPAWQKHDQILQLKFKKLGITVHRLPGALLFELNQILNKSGTPYRVFTPFYKACLTQNNNIKLIARPRALPSVPRNISSLSVADLKLLPAIRWDTRFYDVWQPGENRSVKQLRNFIKHQLQNYKQQRDYPAISATSLLSAALHFGELTPAQIVMALENASDQSATTRLRQQADAVIRQLIWREFTHYLLHHFPHMSDHAWNERYADFPWQQRSNAIFKAWQQGNTGIPIIDAGMRQLWQTGTLHNRVRMLVGSFLTKNALLHWKLGAKWFWDTLVDADLAQNSFNWQWVAGCGADAAPYFRIFNPVTQSKKYDPAGVYLRHWIPEISKVPDKFIHAPWQMSLQQQQKCQVIIGRDYPLPILDLKTSRANALHCYRQWRHHSKT